MPLATLWPAPQLVSPRTITVVTQAEGGSTDWWLFWATVALALATGILAYAACRALGQLRVALAELDEVRTDRHVQVFADLGRRWESAEMTEALMVEVGYTAEGLARLFSRASERPSTNPIKERRRLRDARRRTILLRVPNYFEDAALIAKVGRLEDDLFHENFSGVVADEWSRWGPTVKLLQEGDPLSYVEFEKLATKARAEDAMRPTSS